MKKDLTDKFIKFLKSKQFHVFINKIIKKILQHSFYSNWGCVEKLFICNKNASILVLQ